MKKFTTILFSLVLFVGAMRAQQCPAIPGTSFSNAPLVYCGLDGFNSTLFPPGVGGIESPPSWLIDCGIVDNSHWIAFLPRFSQINFSIEVSNCAFGQGMQGIIYGMDNDNCDINALYDVSNCYSQDVGMADFNLLGTNFVQGEVYYLLLDGWNGDICDYTITMQGMFPFPPLSPPSLSGPSPVTANSTHTYNLEFPDRPDFENPCGNKVEDICSCSPCSYGYITPDNITVTVPPGATYTINNFYEVEVTFGEESGEVCITLEGYCGTNTYCKYVEVVPVCFNNPAPPGDSCINAPLFCADFLDNFCSTTAGLTADTPGNLNSLLSCAVENNAWIRITPCEEDVSLAFDVGDCRDFVGLQIALLSSSDCDTFNLINDCQPVSHATTDTLDFTGLTPGGTYYLMIDGINGDECAFAIDLVDGFFLPDTTSPPPPVVDPFKITQISLAYIEGPECICPGEPATYIYHDAVCIIEQGSCGPIVVNNNTNNAPTSCLPQEACKGKPWLVKVDRFPVWHIPEGAEFDGDSTGYTVDVIFDPLEPCKDSVYSDVFFSVDTACGSPPLPMIPTSGSGTFVDTTFSDTIIQTVWVEIGCTYMLPDSSLVTWIPSENMGGIPDSFYWRDPNPATENVYCPCTGGFSVCGICIEGASFDTGIKIEYDYDTETICDPECFDFAGYSLCDGGQYWLKQTCGYKILNLNIDEPETFDEGMHFLCPWDCFFLPANGQAYCAEGVYDIIIEDPESGCEDHYLFEIYYEPDEYFWIVNLVENCIGPDNDFYTVSFDINSSNSWGGYIVDNEFVNTTFTSAPIPSGDSYSFSINSLGPCPEFQQISGSYTCPCVPETTDLGLFELCPNDCFTLPQNGQDYCNPGNYDIIVPDPVDNCEDHFLFEITNLNQEIVDITNVTENCTPDNNFYSVTFDVNGSAPFLINGQTHFGGPFTSVPIVSGDPYDFTVESTGPCPQINIVSGLLTCVCTPVTIDLGLFELCPGDCFTLPQNAQDYCTPGNYDIIVPNPVDNCEDHFLFEIVNLNLDVVDITNVIENCTPDNNFYSVSFDVNGTAPFLINGQSHSGGTFTSNPIASGDPYNFTVESTGLCPQSSSISGLLSCVCTPVTTNLGLFELCPGDCFTLPQNGQDYCNPGNYDIIVPNPVDNCEDHFLFEIAGLNPDLVDITNVTENCTPDNNFYTITFEVNGTAPFLINGQTHPGGTYTSAPITSGDPYSFTVESIGPCPQSSSISGSFTCPCTPLIEDLGLFQLCPGDCFTLPQNLQDYCTAGNYDIIVINAINNCEDHYLFQLEELNADVVEITNVIETCTPDNSFYSVTFDVNGTAPFLVNGQAHPGGTYTSNPIVTGDPYSFTVESTGPCPVSENSSGSFTCPNCVPEVIDLGILELCQGECFPYNGTTYCDPGLTEVEILNSEGCIDTHRFILDFVTTSIPSTSNLTELCDVTFSNYTVSFTVQGTPPFYVDGNPLPGSNNFFQSSPIPSGSGYLFEVEHSGACAEPIIIQDVFSCQAACANSAGSLRDNSNYLCETQEIQVTHNNNEVLGSDDLLEYILFLGADPMSGQILERNTNGIFAFNINFMTYATPYQVVAVVGNQVGGEVDLQDNCLDISTPIIVTFYELPVLLTGQIEDKVLTCMEDEVTLATSLGGGSGQWQFLWTGNGGSSDSTSISVKVPGVYYFTATDLLTGCSTVDSVKVLENKVFPIIDIQPVLALDCATDRVTLDATNSEQGPPFKFTWSTTTGQFSNPPSTLLTEATSAGTYTLQITNTISGCISERVIEVIDLEDELALVDLDIQQLLCNGSNDAMINIMGITGGNPEYQYTFDGFEYGTQSSFENLSVGSYELHIEDSKGCTLDTLIAITEPAPMDLGLESDYLVIMGEPFQVVVDPNFEIGSIEWTDPNGEIIGTETTLNTFFSRTTTVYIEATDINGCQTKEQISISVPESNNIAFVPSAFSPNNDFNNDWLEIFTHPSVALIQSFKVYSRWGDLVHSCENIQPDLGGGNACSWDGRLKGQALDPAVFVYILEVELINGSKKILTGDIMIVR